MNQNNMNADCIQKNNILHYSKFQFVIEHGISAIFNNNNLSNPLFKIWHSLNQDIRPLLIIQKSSTGIRRNCNF